MQPPAYFLMIELQIRSPSCGEIFKRHLFLPATLPQMHPKDAPLVTPKILGLCHIFKKQNKGKEVLLKVLRFGSRKRLHRPNIALVTTSTQSSKLLAWVLTMLSLSGEVKRGGVVWFEGRNSSSFTPPPLTHSTCPPPPPPFLACHHTAAWLTLE